MLLLARWAGWALRSVSHYSRSKRLKEGSFQMELSAGKRHRHDAVFRQTVDFLDMFGPDPGQP